MMSEATEGDLEVTPYTGTSSRLEIVKGRRQKARNTRPSRNRRETLDL